MTSVLGMIKMGVFELGVPEPSGVIPPAVLNNYPAPSYPEKLGYS